jgi:NodT family efflux transporter outer membrane factor (OMF) lipoprotein
MFNKIIYKILCIFAIVASFTACSIPNLLTKNVNTKTPISYKNAQDSTNNIAKMNWREYFVDANLIALIDTALKNNQELNIVLQEIMIANNEVRARKGDYLPFVDIAGGYSVEKQSRYTRQGSVEENLSIAEGQRTPNPLQNYNIGLYVTWEVDIWRKLRNAKKVAYLKYLSSIEGRNFMVTNLVAEVASSYYELLALDNELEILNQNIDIQTNALRTVKLQKESAKVTELAVRRFEAQVLHTKSLQYSIAQKIIETENKINFLLGRYPQPITRDSKSFNKFLTPIVYEGIPSQLLSNRPDIKQAELDLAAAKLNVQVTKMNFYPSLRLSAGLGLEAFQVDFLIKAPESILYGIAGGLVSPFVNRNAIKATYYTANSKQTQAIYNYERKVLNAYLEVVNQLSNINNLKSSYDLQTKQVEELNRSVNISNDLFLSARADYMEVLLTQRDALESKFNLIETKAQQLHAFVNIYRSLGGGWN